MESRKQSELPQKLGKKIIQALKTQNASSQPKSPIAKSSDPCAEDEHLVSKAISPIGLEIIDHMDFGSQQSNLSEPQNIKVNKQQNYPDPFNDPDDLDFNTNTQFQEYEDSLIPQDKEIEKFNILNSQPDQNNYILREQSHNLNQDLYEEYDYVNENYQSFQSNTPPEFDDINSYESYVPRESLLNDEDVLVSDTAYYSEHNNTMLDYSTNVYDTDHQFAEESYLSSEFDFEDGEDYSLQSNISNVEDDVPNPTYAPLELQKDIADAQVGYNNEDIMPVSKKIPKMIDLDSVILDNNQNQPQKIQEKLPEGNQGSFSETTIKKQLEDVENESYDQDETLSNQSFLSGIAKDDIIPDDIYLENSFDNELYNQEQEEGFNEMTKATNSKNEEIKDSQSYGSQAKKPSVDFERSSDRDYEKLHERSYESNKDTRKMDERISLKEDKDYQKSDEKYFIQHDKDYRRNEERYYPEMEKDHRKYDAKEYHREYKNTEDSPVDKDYIRYDDRLSSYKDSRQHNDRQSYIADRERHHAEYSKDNMYADEKRYNDSDRDYSRFEIKEPKSERDYIRNEESYNQPVYTYDKFNVRYYDNDKDYLHRQEASYYDDRDSRYRNKSNAQEQVAKQELSNTNVETLIRLVLSLPQGVTKQTGAQIIKQTMEAMGISINEVLADAQETQSKMRKHIKDNYNTIDEYKMHVRQLEDEIYQYQKKAKDLDDIVSLFVYSDQPKPMR